MNQMPVLAGGSNYQKILETAGFCIGGMFFYTDYTFRLQEREIQPAV